MSQDFHSRATEALKDQRLRRNFRRAMDGLMTKRAAQFPIPENWQALRAKGAWVRKNSLAKLPELLERLEENCSKNGIKVHWAETRDQANQIVLEILQQHKAKKIIKGKSMVSEEMELNHFLEQNGIKAVESDLGEYIIQLAHEPPSHIVMPCIHKNKEEIAKLFQDNIPGQAYSENVDELTAAARRVLRQEFATADAGISGVNFAVAETGTLVLIENEGNGRLSTTLPPLHIAVTGIEKVVENLADVEPLLALLPRSATGQNITTYVNMISGPRKEGEKDGPREVHLVLLDNGRSRIYADPQLRDTLRCIRCGACMNHCPVYTRVGGHAYGAVYPGPIGKILTPQIEGLDCRSDLLHASTLCGACAEVCPVEIPLTQIMVRLRKEGAAAVGWSEKLTWKGWAWVNSNSGLYKLLGWALTRLGFLIPSFAPPLNKWTLVREKPQFATQSLHEIMAGKGGEHE